MAVIGQQLGPLLNRAGVLLRVAGVGRAAMLGGAVWLQTYLAIIVLDAWLAPRPAVVMTFSVTLLAIAAIAGALAIVALVRSGVNAESLALRIESAAGVTDNRLVNAVHLAAGRASDGSAALAQLALSEGDATAATLRASDALDPGPLHRAATIAGVTLAATLVFLLAAPDVFRAVVPRLLSPMADLPPYSRLTFGVVVAPQPANIGRSAMIRLTLGGRGEIPDTAHVIWLNTPDRPRTAMVMTRPGSFQLAIERVEGESSFFIDTPGGRSGRYTIGVSKAPLIDRLSVTIEPPAYTRRPAITRVLSGWEPPPPVELSTADGGEASPAANFAGPELRVMRGGKISFTVESNAPLARGAIVLTPAAPPRTQPAALPPPTIAGVRVSMQPAADKLTTVSAGFAAETSGRIEITVEGRSGWGVSAPAIATLIVEDDGAPSTRIVDPDDYAVAPANWKLPVSAAAEDDVSIERFDLDVKLAGSDRKPASWVVTGKGTSVASARGTIDLQRLGAKAGDELVMRTQAVDGKPGRSSPTLSAPVRVRILSDAEYAKLVRERYGKEESLAEEETFRREAERLEQRARELLGDIERWKKQSQASNGDEAESLRQRIESGLDDFSDDADRFADAMRLRARPPHVFDFEREYAKLLESESDRWAECSGGANQAGRGMGASAGGASANDRAAASKDIDAGAIRVRQTLGDGGKNAWRQARESMNQSGDLARSGPRNGSGSSGVSGENGSSGVGAMPMGPHFAQSASPSESRTSSANPSAAAAGGGGDRKPDRDKPPVSIVGRPYPSNDPERYTPKPRTNISATAADLDTVPPQYRDQAEAYFRRLAEER